MPAKKSERTKEAEAAMAADKARPHMVRLEGWVPVDLDERGTGDDINFIPSDNERVDMSMESDPNWQRAFKHVDIRNWTAGGGADQAGKFLNDDPHVTHAHHLKQQEIRDRPDDFRPAEPEPVDLDNYADPRTAGPVDLDLTQQAQIAPE